MSACGNALFLSPHALWPARGGTGKVTGCPPRSSAHTGRAQRRRAAAGRPRARIGAGMPRPRRSKRPPRAALRGAIAQAATIPRGATAKPPSSRRQLGAGLNPCGAKVIFIYDMKKQGSLACAGGGDRWSGRHAAVTSCRAGPYPAAPEVLRRPPARRVPHAAWGRPA